MARGDCIPVTGNGIARGERRGLITVALVRERRFAKRGGMREN